MFRLSIHPGSVRSGVFECMNDESLEMWIWDSHDVPVDEVSVDDIINWMKDNLNGRKGQKYVFFNYSWLY